ncbi:hypothetical protein HBB16_12370 [Pseudonocardia sp. MCCB 268]|nr:hypothetical protein [Pseudonocardia cytotoxica]
MDGEPGAEPRLGPAEDTRSCTGRPHAGSTSPERHPGLGTADSSDELSYEPPRGRPVVQRLPQDLRPDRAPVSWGAAGPSWSHVVAGQGGSGIESAPALAALAAAVIPGRPAPDDVRSALARS